eukprot:GEMP01030278.1.p1 GENE.GEMP01030278.1~~GEMP01030278.1.p1  ORF type:complete len:529 (+),score=98.23 GEMP01030278.1:97-1683(+)
MSDAVACVPKEGEITRGPDELWMKNVLESLMEENAASLMAKREDCGWTTDGPWLFTMGQMEEVAWADNMQRLRAEEARKTTKRSEASSKRLRSKSSRDASKESRSSLSVDFDPEKLPPTPPSDDGEIWDPNASSNDSTEETPPKLVPLEESADIPVAEPRVRPLQPDKKICRPLKVFADKTRWRRTVESFDDSLDNEKLWSVYLKHFTTADLNWLSDHFMKSGGRRGFISIEDAIAAAHEYACIRWSLGCANSLVLDDVDEICERLQIAKAVDFDRLVKFVYRFQQKALDTDVNSGFKESEILFLKDVFRPYVKIGVPTRNIFEFIGMLGHGATEEEQSHMQTIFKTLNLQGQCRSDGTVSFYTFLYFLQHVHQMEDQEYRKREQSQVIKSGFKDKEIEEFRVLFDRFVDTPEQELSLAALKEMFKDLMMPLTLAQTKEVASIIRASDENCNDLIDFGEFVCLLRELWERDFADLKTITQKIDDRSSKRRTSMGEIKASSDAGVNGRRSSMRRRSTVEKAMIKQSAKQ